MPRTTRALLLTASLAGVLLLAACSGSSGGSAGAAGGSSSAPAAGSSASPSAGAAGRANGFRGPAASGTIAAITGTTMQVQNQQSGQVAVRWTGTTAFTAEVAASASTIKVGTCVTVAGASGTSATATSFAAATVRVEPSCTLGTGSARPSGFPSGARPSGVPSGARPSGFPGGGRQATARAFAVGKVSAVSGSKLTITGRTFGSSGSTTRTVTLTGSTKITTTAKASAKSLAVGKCVTAQGKADSSGAVTASRVAVSNPTGGTCTAGFGRVGSGG
jgi:hypothetical protein